jgi:hypothetical protein
MRLLPLVLVLALPATASAARLLDVEPAGPSLLGTPGPAPAAIGFGEHLGKTVGLGVFSSTAGVLLAVPLGMLSNALLGQLPALLVSLLVGPALTTLGAWLIGNHDDAGRFGYWGAFGVTALVHLAVLLVTSLALPVAVAWTNPVSLLLYSLVDGLLMSGASVGFMHLVPRRRAAPATLQSFAPGVSDTAFVPLSSVEL